MRIPGIHFCYLSVHSIMHSAIPFARIFHSASYYGYDVNVALLAFMFVRCSLLRHYNFAHIFYFIRNVWHQQHQLNGRPQSKHSSLNGLKLFVCNIFTVGSVFLPWLYGDRVTDFLFIFQPWEILLEHNDKIKKNCMLEKKSAFFQLHLVRARDSQSKCLKLKCAKNFKVQLCQEDDKIDNFPSACIQKKAGQLASLYTVFSTPIWIYWKFRASRLFLAPFVFELVFSLSSLWYHFGITLSYF